MLDEFTPSTSEPQYRGSFQQLADARRVLKITNSLRAAPMLAEDRLEVEKVRALAIRAIELATEELIETLDALHDPDVEDDDPAEEGGDKESAAWVEWHTMRGPSKRGANFTLGAEDAEDDDPAEPNGDEGDSNNAEDEILYASFGNGPGCPISDPDYGEDGS